MNFRYPIFLDLTGKRCVVTGAGPEIAAKIRGLVEACADVVYVNPDASPEIAVLVETGSIRWQEREFQPEDLDGCFLAITARPDNGEVFRLAEERKILCNAPDDPEHCRFSFGSVHRQGDLTIAISTNGFAPALAVRLRQRLERDIGPEYGMLVELLKEVRPEISARIPEFAARRDLWYQIVDSGALSAVREGHPERAAGMIREMIENAASSTSHSDTSGDGAGQ